MKWGEINDKLENFFEETKIGKISEKIFYIVFGLIYICLLGVGGIFYLKLLKISGNFLIMISEDAFWSGVLAVFLLLAFIYVYDKRKDKKKSQREENARKANNLYNNSFKILGKLIIQEEIGSYFDNDGEIIIKTINITTSNNHREKAVDIANVFLDVRKKSFNDLNNPLSFRVKIYNEELEAIINSKNYSYLDHNEKVIAALGSAFLVNYFEEYLEKDTIDSFVESVFKDNILKSVTLYLKNELDNSQNELNNLKNEFDNLKNELEYLKNR